MVWSCPQPCLLISFPAHFHIASPAQSALMNAFPLLKWNKSFLFLGNLHILFFAPGGGAHLSAVNSQSLTSFPVSVGSAFGCAHSLLSGDGSSHKDISCHCYPVSESESGCFWGWPNISKLLPKHKTFSFLFFHHGQCWCLTLGSSPYVHKVAARDLSHHCTQMRKEGRLFISCLSSLAETRNLHQSVL